MVGPVDWCLHDRVRAKAKVAIVIAVRPCTLVDLPFALSITNELIPTTTIAWTDVLVEPAARMTWLADQEARGFPVLVAVDSDSDEVVGIASYDDFRDTLHWEGYRFTVEHSIHVRGDRRGSGTGRVLLEALIAHARSAGIHVMVGAIDADNAPSLRFHERMGFVEVARLPETGFKFGRWLDLILMQRVL